MATAFELLPLYAKSLIKRPAVPDDWPALTRCTSGLTIDPDPLRQYLEVTGQTPVFDRLPPCYLQILAFKPVLELLTDARFPLRLLGLVHIRNQIQQKQPVFVHDALDMMVRLGSCRTTHRGYEFDVIITASRATFPVWEARMGILSRARTDRERPAQTRGTNTESFENQADLGPVPACTGRRYAGVSGDFNPIHLYASTARVFGFKRPIAHGMWTLARALAPLRELWHSGVFHLDTHFRYPVYLPCPGLQLEYNHMDTTTRFRVRSADEGQIHLVGELNDRLRDKT